MVPPRIEFDIQNNNEAGILDVEPNEVFEKRTKVRIIDVRRPEEWVGELGHIQGAELMTLDYIPEKLGELPKDLTYVFVCRSGGRSTQAGLFAKSIGFENVYNMRGGMMLWNQMGLEVVRK